MPGPPAPIVQHTMSSIVLFARNVSRVMLVGLFSNERSGQHRRNYYAMLKGWCWEDDEYSLGLHLIDDHGSCEESDFETSEFIITLFILDDIL